MSIAAARLKSFVERIERLREEKRSIGQDERDVFSEAKGVGFDTKAMREVLKRRAMDDTEQWDSLIDTYEHALGVRGEAARIVSEGGTYDEAADKTGLARATVARAVASRKNLENDTPIEASRGVSGPGGSGGSTAAITTASASAAASEDDGPTQSIRDGAEQLRRLYVEAGGEPGVLQTNNAPVAVGVAEESNAAPRSDANVLGASERETQADGAAEPPLSVTPAPDGGVGTGTISESCGGVESRHALKANTDSVRADGKCPHDPAISGGSPVSVGPVYPKDDRENSAVPPERSVNPVAAIKQPEAGEGDATTAQRVGAGVASGPQDPLDAGPIPDFLKRERVAA